MCSLYNNNIFISYIKYANITPPANSKANRGIYTSQHLIERSTVKCLFSLITDWERKR